MTHEELVEKAKEAITEVFNDKSVGILETKRSLEDISGDIEIMLSALEDDE